MRIPMFGRPSSALRARSRYAALILACCHSTDDRVAEHAWSCVPAWAPSAGDISAAILDGLTDLRENSPWRHAATTLVALVRAGDSGPVLETCLQHLIDDVGVDGDPLERLLFVRRDPRDQS